MDKIMNLKNRFLCSLISVLLTKSLKKSLDADLEVELDNAELYISDESDDIKLVSTIAITLPKETIKKLMSK